MPYKASVSFCFFLTLANDKKLIILNQTALHIAESETNINPINAPTPNPTGHAGLPQQGQTEDTEYNALIISHHRKKEERYIFFNALPIHIHFFLYAFFGKNRVIKVTITYINAHKSTIVAPEAVFQ